VRAEDTHGTPGLHQQRFVVFQAVEHSDDAFHIFPASGGFATPAGICRLVVGRW